MFQNQTYRIIISFWFNQIFLSILRIFQVIFDLKNLNFAIFGSDWNFAIFGSDWNFDVVVKVAIWFECPIWKFKSGFDSKVTPTFQLLDVS